MFFDIEMLQEELVVITIHGLPKNKFEIETYTDQFKTLYATFASFPPEHKFTMMFDLTLDIHFLDLPQAYEFVRIKAQLLEALRDVTRERILGTAVVLHDRPVLAKLLDFGLSMYKNTRPITIVSTIIDAMDWIKTLQT